MNAKIKTAVILAAGLGSRLKALTAGKPKGFVMIEGKSLIERSLSNLKAAGIERIIIGTGYLAEQYQQLSKHWPGIECIENNQYQKTGSMFTLYNLRSRIDSDFLLLESDLLYAQTGLQKLLAGKQGDIILSSGLTDASDGVYIEVDRENNLVDMSKDPAQLNSVYSELVGISKISLTLYRSMCQYAASHFAAKPLLDYEYALVGVSNEHKIYVDKIENYAWCEIDDAAHLRRAQEKIIPQIKAGEK